MAGREVWTGLDESTARDREKEREREIGMYEREKEGGTLEGKRERVEWVHRGGKGRGGKEQIERAFSSTG